jgi:hypothetical protein
MKSVRLYESLLEITFFGCIYFVPKDIATGTAFAV